MQLKVIDLQLNNTNKKGFKMSTDKAAAVCSKIRKQFNSDPRSTLFFKIVESVIDDAAIWSKSKRPEEIKNRRTAWAYINDNMPACEICGVDSEWVRDQIRKAGLTE